jgi:predicted NBD/HSP70 family sugar kinase
MLGIVVERGVMTQAARRGSTRIRNLELVLGEVDRRGPLTRAALAEVTGLTKTTVSTLVAELIAAGFVAESGVVRVGERGRPGVAVGVSGDRVAALGIEVNVDYLAVCAVDLTRTVRLRTRVERDNRDTRPVDVLRDLRALALDVVAQADAMGLTVVGAVVAVPGPVEDGLLYTAPNLGWREVPVAAALDLPVPVEVDNEANLAALGELWFGSGIKDFLYVSGEIGIGAGLVVGGELFRGVHGNAGELGHVVVEPTGPPCRCGGHGCLEWYAGQDALLRPATRGIADLVSRLEKGDPRAQEACSQAGRALGIALTSAANLLDLDRIVLGGIFVPVFPWLSAAVESTLSARLGHLRRSVPVVAVSHLDGEAATLGAAGQVLQQVIADPGRFAGQVVTSCRARG